MTFTSAKTEYFLEQDEELTIDILFARLAKALPGYEVREAQLELSRKIFECFETGVPMVAEAGTGTGKSAALLVAAILHAHLHGGKAVIATATLALQEQYLLKDLPMLRSALGIGFNYVLAKGRSNYLSIRRLGNSATVPPHVRAWALETETGDKSEIHDLDNSVWEEIKSDRDDCLGQSCPTYNQCHYFSSREALATANIIITNQSLVTIDYVTGNNLLPPYDLLVIDEAHQLPDFALKSFSEETSERAIKQLVRRVNRQFKHEFGAHAQALGFDVQMVFEELAQDSTDRLIRDRDRQTLMPLVNRLKEFDLYMGERYPDMVLTPTQAHHFERIREALNRFANNLERIICRTGNDGHGIVNWIEFEAWANGEGQSITIRTTPIDVSRPLRNWLFEPDSNSTPPTSIWLSATIATPDFEWFKKQIGLTGISCVEMQVGSPFDYAGQSLLYTPRGLPNPNSEDYAIFVADEVRRLLRVSQGRALVLFTSNKAMAETYNLVASHVPWPIKTQHHASKRLLLEWLESTPHAVLFASGMWEGISVVGHQLSMVIIDRIPFAPPGNPVYDARCEELKRVTSDEWAWFTQLQIPNAITRLKQGVGRLIRAKGDTGIVALLDPRLSKKGYGARILRSLPPMQRTQTFDAEYFEMFITDPPPVAPVAPVPVPVPIVVEEAPKVPKALFADRSLNAEEIQVIHDALKQLAGRCDGAAQLDGVGFSKIHADYGHSLASQESLSPNQARAGLPICLHYQRQLDANVVRVLKAASSKIGGSGNG